MEMFRVGGVSSEDLLRQGQNNAKAFLGTMFKMGDGKKNKAAEAPVPEVKDVKLETVDVDHVWTKKELSPLKKEKLVEIAGSLGVSDINVTKEKLIEAIMAVQ